jgi:hypothetical protein
MKSMCESVLCVFCIENCVRFGVCVMYGKLYEGLLCRLRMERCVRVYAVYVIYGTLW